MLGAQRPYLRVAEYHIHVPDAESSGAEVVIRDFDGPKRVAQTNHKEITRICLQALRHGVGDFCAIISALPLRFAIEAPHTLSSSLS